jgi:HEAT repeat protein
VSGSVSEKMDDESSELLEQLKDPSPARRVAAANALRRFERVHPQIIAALIAAAEDAERDVRVSAVKALVGVWRTLNAPAADYWIYDGEADQFFELANGALKKSLRDEDKYVRLAAAEGLRELYCSDQEVFDVFVAAAYD